MNYGTHKLWTQQLDTDYDHKLKYYVADQILWIAINAYGYAFRLPGPKFQNTT